MIRYLKYIVIVFGSIGISVAAFFAYQNRVDLVFNFHHGEALDYDYLQENCLGIEGSYYYPCAKKNYIEFLKGVSLTGTNIGLRSMFSVLEEDKEKTTLFADETTKDIVYTLNYLEINNLTMENAYQRYFGLDALYGGFLASLGEFYERSGEFSENLITGLESPSGIDRIRSEAKRAELLERFGSIRDDYYRIKSESAEFIEKETARITSLAK